ncbi:tripartite motif-containing protein 2-like [Anneissia japonica]|uniref:tripartite motif-containing protein 2-like n=1 Tax=Anneissia japonica TaxID=1529436 RepID=UPI00142585B2|nr:tripartite motif-containing protein 2-like [Anneissia japonica]
MMANFDSILHITECSIHMGQLERPKLLLCQHTFCEDCLKTWCDNSNGKLVCPVCKRDYGRVDVSQLPNDRTRVSLLEAISDPNNAVAGNSTIENVRQNPNDRTRASSETVSDPNPPKHQPGFKFGQVKYYGAHDAAVHDDEIFITDKCNHRVVVINKGGQELRSFTIEEDNMLAFDPFGITISTTGKLYVTDMKNHEVFVCDLYGNVRQRIGKHVLKKPNGIALTTNNEILVVDYEDCCVHRFGMNGVVKSTVGGPGTGRFSHPWFIAINSKGEWIVSDCDNKCFHIIHDGRSRKVDVGCNVRGVTVDSRDNIFITIAESGWKKKFAVLMYRPNGELYGYISRKDTLLRPRGMCTTKDTYGKEILIVTDDSKELHIYDIV